MDKIQLMKAKCEKIKCYYRLDEPMCEHTSFKIGGRADLYIRPSSQFHITEILRFAHSIEYPVKILGKGTNVLIPDKGIQAGVMAITHYFGEIALTAQNIITCTAGIPLARLCHFAYLHGLTGLEFAWGIPGSVGGAVYMNAGAYTGEIKDVLLSITHADRQGNITELENPQMSYRHSYYSDTDDCILCASFKLMPGDKAVIKETMADYMYRRTTKQPLEHPSAGSTFKRPTGNYASALIDKCGLKGLSLGGASVSEKHAGFIINHNNASCDDVLRLIEKVQREVFAQTGYTLECEIDLWS